MGTMHGGIIATLVDSAMGCAVFSMLPAGAAFTTLELKTNYVRPIVQTTGVVRAEGRVVHLGGRVATDRSDASATKHGTLYAHATSTCMIKRPTGTARHELTTRTPSRSSTARCSPSARSSPTDVDRLERMFFRLSPDDRVPRFFSPIHEPSQRMLMWLTNVDHDRREALVAVDGDEIVAVARYDGRPGATEAEIAVTVEDAWQHRGIGQRLARRLAACRAGPRLRARSSPRCWPTTARRSACCAGCRLTRRVGSTTATTRRRAARPRELTRAQRALRRRVRRFGRSREAVHEPQPRPRVVDRAHLVVDETVRETDVAHDVLGEVGRDVRGLLRPRDPQPAGGLDRAARAMPKRRSSSASRVAKNSDDVLRAARLCAEAHTVGQRIERDLRNLRVRERARRRATRSDSQLLREWCPRIPRHDAAVNRGAAPVNRAKSTSRAWTCRANVRCGSESADVERIADCSEPAEVDLREPNPDSPLDFSGSRS